MSLLQGLLLVVGGLVVALLLVRVFERHMVFYPSRYPEGYWQPQSLGLAVRDVFFKAGNQLQLHGWLIPHPNARAQLLMCHGNAGNISDRLELLQILHSRIAANLFIFDYRGYGRSQGEPDERGVYDDAVAAFDWLQASATDLPVIVHGHSLGSAVAVELATRRSAVAGLILESPFTNARDMARLIFGRLPVHLLSSMRWASDEKIAQLHMPKLFLHGGADHTVPLRLGRQLFDRATAPKEFVAMPFGDHNNLYLIDSEQYFGAIQRLLEQCEASPGPGPDAGPAPVAGRQKASGE